MEARREMADRSLCAHTNFFGESPVWWRALGSAVRMVDGRGVVGNRRERAGGESVVECVCVCCLYTLRRGAPAAARANPSGAGRGVYHSSFTLGVVGGAAISSLACNTGILAYTGTLPSLPSSPTHIHRHNLLFSLLNRYRHSLNKQEMLPLEDAGCALQCS